MTSLMVHLNKTSLGSSARSKDINLDGSLDKFSLNMAGVRDLFMVVPILLCFDNDVLLMDAKIVNTRYQY